MITLSVVTINLNNAKGLNRTLNSMFSCKMNFEIIVVDGLSNDDSVSKVNNSKLFNKIKLITEKDKGVYDAMNKGIKASRGEWIIFMNSGDTFYDFSEINDIIINNSSADVIYGKYIHSNIVRDFYDLSYLQKGVIHACHQSMIFNKNRLKHNLFYSDQYKIYGDYELVNRIYLQGFNFKSVNNVISDFEGGGMSSDISWLKRKEKFLIVFRNYGVKGLINAFL